jgi:hypothetical protein
MLFKKINCIFAQLTSVIEYVTQFLSILISRCSYGDWFVLYQMSRNMNRRFFSEFIAVLSRRVDPRFDLQLFSIFLFLFTNFWCFYSYTFLSELFLYNSHNKSCFQDIPKLNSDLYWKTLILGWQIPLFC